MLEAAPAALPPDRLAQGHQLSALQLQHFAYDDDMSVSSTWQQGVTFTLRSTKKSPLISRQLLDPCWILNFMLCPLLCIKT